jgi:hypothetical protein
MTHENFFRLRIGAIARHSAKKELEDLKVKLFEGNAKKSIVLVESKAKRGQRESIQRVRSKEAV